jgi:Flp pilus assembly protein TadD
MLDWQLYGAAPAGHHFTSIFIHALNAVLVLLVLRRLGGGLAWSALAAAVFAWHPLRVESVVWVTERKDVLSGTFFLLTLLAYARYVAARQAGGSWWRSYALVVACFSLGLMSKPMLVTLPLVLLLLDGWPFRRATTFASWWSLVLEKLPLFVLSALVSVVTVLMQRHEAAFVLDLPLGARAGNAVVSLARYLGKFFWPSNLIVCYEHPGYWPTLAVVAAATLMLALGWLAWRQRHSRPWLAAGGLWYVVVLLPVIGLVQVGFQAMADRYTYLALLGIEVALIWSIAPVVQTPRAKAIAGCVAAALLTALAGRTWVQEGYWHDSIALFEHAVSCEPENGRAEEFLASALYAANRIDEASGHAERACALEPANDAPLLTLAGIRERQDRVPEAIALFRRGLALRPDNPLVQMELGLLELSSGHAEEAHRIMTAALRAKPDLRERTMGIAQKAVENRDGPTALFFFQILVEARPEDTEAHIGLGFVLLQTGHHAEGLAEWHRALELAPNYPGLREQIAQAEAAP